jgi:hypothetical protein
VLLFLPCSDHAKRVSLSSLSHPFNPHPIDPAQTLAKSSPPFPWRRCSSSSRRRCFVLVASWVQLTSPRVSFQDPL